MKFSLGVHDLTKIDKDVAQECKAVTLHPHPGFDGGSAHDIMLAKMKCRVRPNKYIMPAKLPPAYVDPNENENCSVCGWGNTEYPNFKPAKELQCVDLPVISNHVCNKSYRGAIHEDIMCIGLMKGGKDSCQGDSGGPALCSEMVRSADGSFKETEPYLHGIVMGGLYCAQKDYPGVYTRVSHYVEWIVDTIRDKKNNNRKDRR